ncbi:hypothetical protein CERSUDRAFT_78610 [Gelatoporia subvermispora B]|uniref:Uncharacterized protein n=1 Tax=Ceriporiopsis subvermispora (strain B) TaxID=914234 RepID=M2Q1V8_CERS8|nr:hypothetical protein CERSUDRAFT_78610 [Gelatoporia subvermispora B]
MVSGFKKNMERADLLALRICQLEKRDEDIRKAAKTLEKARLKSKEEFERRFKHRIRQREIRPGTLVLRYLGPYEVVRHTKGGSYMLKELDGTMMRVGIAVHLSTQTNGYQDLVTKVQNNANHHSKQQNNAPSPDHAPAQQDDEVANLIPLGGRHKYQCSAPLTERLNQHR